MKTENNLKQSYFTYGQWHGIIKEFLKQNEGNYLEIGSFWGYFVAELGLQYTQKHIYGIDPFISDGYLGPLYPKGSSIHDVREICLHNIKDISNVTLFKTTTKDFLSNGNVDILDTLSCVLIDGSHHYEDILTDIELVIKINNKLEKLIVFDDLGISDVQNAIVHFEKVLNNRISKKIEPGIFMII
jgi:hypothetical protein